MFKTEWLQVKGKLLINRKRIVYGPLFWQIEEFPFTATFGTSMVMSVHVFPAFFFLWGIPDDLWVWAYQRVFAPTLELFTL